jgi:hypothetical protein
VQTARFRVWLKSGARPIWTGVKLVDAPQYDEAGCVDVTVAGNGYDLRKLIAKRRDIFQ